MAKKNNRTLKREAQKRTTIVAELYRYSEYLTRSDLGNWRNAWQSAIDVRNPDRQKLYNIYRDTMVDGHLSGCIQQRVGFVMARSFKLVDASGKKNEKAAHYFDQAWFKDLCRHCLDSLWWGHSLIELGDVITDGDGCPCLSGVTLIPRKHVVPEYGRVVHRAGQLWSTGINYHEKPWTDWLIEAGQPDDLGLLLKASLHTIPKKHASSFWDCFAEVFGMPLRVAKTSSRDDKEHNKLLNMLASLGNAGSAVIPMDSELQFIESSRGDAYNVYDRRIDRANSELSKLIIGQTMTIEDGSSLSQSQTHLKVFENLVESDRDMLRDIINNQLIPRMVLHGFPLKGLRFEWDDAIDYTPEQQVAYETMIADRYDVDPSYFADKYGMPVGERRNPMALPVPDDSDDEPGVNDSNDDDEKNSRRNFFD